MSNALSFRPVVVIVRDGWGRNPHREHDAFNAVHLAKTPVCDHLLDTYPWTLIHTSGEDVGLPEATMGNSEVGHQNIGAGRVVDQESVRITKAIRTGEFFDNEALCAAVRYAQQQVPFRHVHLLGIASDAGVHGLMTHLYACLELCQRLKHDRVALHLFTDGRDTGPFTGKDYVAAIQAKCHEIGVGKIASVCGRYFAMDRDNRWQRVEKAYACLTGLHARKLGLPFAQSPLEAIQRYYDHPSGDSQQGDEFVTPTMIGRDLDDALSTRIQDGDAVIFYNYRGDRPRQIIKAFTLDDPAWADVPASPDTGVKGFDRGRRLGAQVRGHDRVREGLADRRGVPQAAEDGRHRRAISQRVGAHPVPLRRDGRNSPTSRSFSTTTVRNRSRARRGAWPNRLKSPRMTCNRR